MNEVKVTGLITSYNNGKYFADALKGMLNQTFPVHEIIVVDDASTDNTRDIIDQALSNVQHTKVKFIKRETNGGPAGARNTGIESAEGDVIAFCDGDDFYYKNKVLKSLQALYDHAEMALVYTDYDMLYQDQNKAVRELKHPYNKQLLENFCIVSTNSIVKRKVFDVVGLFDERFVGTEDYQMWLRISRQFPMMRIPESLFAYRIHGNNITMTPEKSAKFQRDIETFKKEILRGQQ